MKRGSFSTRSMNGYKQYNSGSGWKFVHRRVAEKKIGHAIPKGHEVHHKNRNKQDNRFSNLSVLPKWLHRAIHKK